MLFIPLLEGIRQSTHTTLSIQQTFNYHLLEVGHMQQQELCLMERTHMLIQHLYQAPH